VSAKPSDFLAGGPVVGIVLAIVALLILAFA